MMPVVANLEKSQVIEDRYIAYLANRGNEKIINYSDKHFAWHSRKHPYFNALSAALQGLIGGAVSSAFIVLAQTFIDTQMRKGIYGSTADVCDQCASYTKSLVNLLISHGIVAPSEKPLTYLEQQTTSVARHIEVASVSSLCKEDELMKCRVVNFIGNVSNLLSINSISMVLITVGALSALIIGDLKFKDLTAEETRQADLLKYEVEDKFLAIANRLASFVQTVETRQYASDILSRRQAIENEIINELKIPNLNSQNVKRITQPIFDAAHKIINSIHIRIPRNRN